MSTLPPGYVPPPPAAPSGTDHDALPPGTRFGEFEIIRVLGVGGFGIVYLANDHSLEREVALKEYMPASLAARGLGPQITVRSSSFAETYAIGLRSFVNEARLLARFDHPSLVKVYRFWEDNATAYMVMPFLQGVTLRDTRRRMAHPPDEAWIRSVINPILSALELLHREGVYHRDIAPDNILLPPDGPPVLLDFGAARRVISDRTQSLTAILKPSYAPIEQYAEMTQLRQGPWTDLYALGAVIHFLMFGVPPAPATARAVQDDADQIENRIVPGVSPKFLEAVAWMLSIRPNQRPQNGEQLRAVLDGNAAIPARGGRPGITIPQVAGAGAAPNGQTLPPPGPSGQTLVPTAHMPTYLPTALVPPPGAPRPTTFHPTAQMPSPRVDVSQFDPATAPSQHPAAAAGRTLPPEHGPTTMPAPAGDWSVARPATQPPPLPGAPSQFVAAATTATARTAATARQAPPPAEAPGSAPVMPAAVVKPGSSKLGLIVAGVAALLVGGAALAWFATRHDGGAAGATASSADATRAAALPGAAAASTPALTPAATAVTAAPARETAPPAVVAETPARADDARSAALPPRATTPAGTTAAPTATAATTGTTLQPTSPLARPPLAERTPAPTTDRNSAANGRTAIDADAGARTRPVGRPVPRAGDLDTAPSGTAATGYGGPAVAGTARPPGTPVPTGRPVPTTQQAQAASPASVQPHADGQPASAREACGRRVFIALAVCMDDRCEEPRYRNTAECVDILERKHARENR